MFIIFLGPVGSVECEEWKLKLRAIQSAACPNGTAFRQIAWSAIRFDESDSLRLLCQMLLPVGLLLASQSSDSRIQPDLRQHSTETLRKMTTEFIVSLGLYADLSAEVNRLLRQFDVEWHDPALSRKQLAEFRKRPGMRAV